MGLSNPATRPCALHLGKVHACLTPAVNNEPSAPHLGQRAHPKKRSEIARKTLPNLLLERGKGSVFIHLAEGIIDGIRQSSIVLVHGNGVFFARCHRF